LENRRSQNDEMSGEVWETVEASAGKIGMEETERRRSERRSREERDRKRKQKKGKMVEVKRIAEEWKIWNKEEKVARSEVEAKKLVLERFHK